jgi:hypothetical protein
VTGAAGEYRDRPVRPYVITGGRAAPTRNTIRPETLLIADGGRPLPVSATREQRRLVALCQGLMSLAEAAAHLNLPVSVVAIVASDLVDTRYLTARTPAPETSRDILQELLDGLRRL